MLSNIRDVICIISPDGIALYESPNIERLFGWRQEDVVGRVVWERVHPEDVSWLRDAFVQMLEAGEETRTYVFRYLLPDGRHRWVEVTAVNRCNDPNIGGVLANYHDITERRAAEEKLRRREEQFRLAVQGTKDGLWDWDPKRDIAFRSERYAEMLGYEHEELPEKNDVWVQLLHPEDRGRAVEQVAAYLRRETETYRANFRMRAKDGSYRWISGRGMALWDDEGNPTRFVGFNRDITEEMGTRRQLEEERRRCALAQKVARIGNWEFDTQTRELWGSEMAFEIFGIPFDRTRNPRQILSVEDMVARIPDSERVQAALRAFIAGGETFSLEYTAIHGAEEREVVLFSRAERTLVDGVVRIAGTIQDITERKRAEEEHQRLYEQLQQSQKMETVGRLAGGIAHDFNNMLGAILGNIELAKQQLAAGLPAATELDEIEKAARRSANLTRQLLGFARKQTVAPKVLALNGVMGGMLRMLERLIGENIRLRWRPARELWSVSMDPGQVDQILTNLIVNARDAIDETGRGTGRITLSTANVRVSAPGQAEHGELPAGDYAVVAVEDDGCGMDAEVLQRLFEPFFTTKPLGQGTGLGLATVYGVARQNGGAVVVASSPGAGARFRVYLPRHVGSHEEKPAPRQRAVSGSERILLVEDEPALLRMGRRMLENLGYTVLTARRPGEAIRIVEESGEPIDMLLTDVMMPEMNGRALAERLQQSRPGLRVLFMSGYTADIIAREGALDPGTSFLQKPFSRAELAEKVRSVLG